MIEWQPISSAPKDEPVMLYCPTLVGRHTFRLGRWDEDQFAETPRPFWRYSTSLKPQFMRFNPPSHWMPLPAPPSAESLDSERAAEAERAFHSPEALQEAM